MEEAGWSPPCDLAVAGQRDRVLRAAAWSDIGLTGDCWGVGQATTTEPQQEREVATPGPRMGSLLHKESNESPAVKRQAEGFSNPMYQLLNLFVSYIHTPLYSITLRICILSDTFVFLRQ